MPISVTDENFDQEIKKTDKMVLVDFYATWCEPCSMLAPILEKMEKEFAEKLVLLKANVDDVPQHSAQFQVESIPKVVLFKQGKPVGDFIGFKPEAELKAWLEEMLAKNINL